MRREAAAPPKILREAWRSREIGVERLPWCQKNRSERLDVFSGIAQRVARVETASTAHRRPAARRGTASKASRRPHRGVEPLPRHRDGQRQGLNPFQGAFPAGDGLKSGSKGRRRPEEVKKPIPRRFTRRRRSPNSFQADAQRDFLFIL